MKQKRKAYFLKSFTQTAFTTVRGHQDKAPQSYYGQCVLQHFVFRAGQTVALRVKVQCAPCQARRQIWKWGE